MISPTSHMSNERRPAIWPYLVMPLVVLLVFYTLQRFQDAAKIAAAQSQAQEAGSDSAAAEQ